MKVVKKNVYYCDFCKKRSLSGGHMRRHENHCTANPNRNCRLCEGSIEAGVVVASLKLRYRLTETTNEDYGEAIQTVEWIGEPVTMDEIRRITDNCPACMLAIMRQSKLNWSCFKLQFDYKKESEEALRYKQRENHTPYY